jgi:hypothetical protein
MAPPPQCLSSLEDKAIPVARDVRGWTTHADCVVGEGRPLFHWSPTSTLRGRLGDQHTAGPKCGRSSMRGTRNCSSPPEFSRHSRNRNPESRTQVGAHHERACSSAGSATDLLGAQPSRGHGLARGCGATGEGARAGGNMCRACSRRTIGASGSPAADRPADLLRQITTPLSQD